LPNPDRLNNLLQPGYRLLTAVLVGISIFLISSFWFTYIGARLVLAWDAGVMVLLILITTMMRLSTPHQTASRARNEETSSALILLVVLVTVAGTLVAITYGLTKMKSLSPAMRAFHVYQSVAGVVLAWLLIHTTFSLHYAKLYYSPTDDRPNMFRKGLTFPGEKDVVDYWDFFYYSLTIAMCFQTSDVTVTSPYLRRLTIFHAIVSYFFALGILGLLLDIISNIL
jgi:uncharacterized membrane protein